MSTFIKVEVDLSDYEDDYILKSEIQDLIDELEKELYVYTTKSITTVEQVVDKLKELV